MTVVQGSNKALAGKLRGRTVFVGCGFAAKYVEGGGNFSVPLQWMLGLRRLGVDAIWLEYLPGSGRPAEDEVRRSEFFARMREHGLERNFCLLYHSNSGDAHDLADLECYGLSREALQRRIAADSLILNLCYSIHPPFLLQFGTRCFCDLDPDVVTYWMSRIEMGQSYHQHFWTVGLNVGAADCKCPVLPLQWRTFFPLVDVGSWDLVPPPSRHKLTTVGQWYWGHGMEIDGGYPDLSKRAYFEPYMALPRHVPEVELELAINLNEDDPEIGRVLRYGWAWIHPHRVAATPQAYRRYIAAASGEFTVCKGLYVPWRTGWISDRAAAFLASGRPMITEDTQCSKFLPDESGFLWMDSLESAIEAVRKLCRDWPHLSRIARATAMEYFDAPKTLERMLTTLT